MTKFNQLCVWPGTTTGDSSKKKFEEFFLENFGVRVKFAEETLTNPDLDEFGQPVPQTGGRSDLLFYIHDEDISKFAVPRLKAGIRWWEDVVSYNNHADLYKQEILDKYPVRW